MITNRNIDISLFFFKYVEIASWPITVQNNLLTSDVIDAENIDMPEITE